MQELKTVENDLRETIRILRETFGEGYAFKNPELVRFLMETVQREKDRSFAKSLNKVN
jgi:hypothetical protein